MFNFVHAWLHRPERGWDPVPAAYADTYSAHAWSHTDEALVRELEAKVGGFAGQRVLDLGGGPGQFSVAFARRGARVTWHDVSRNYERNARRHSRDAGVEVAFSLGYLEDAARLGSFDFVFNRVCWYYGKSDRGFARVVHGLVRPGGFGYVDCNPAEIEQPNGRRRFVYWLNNRLGIKIGHPFPPHGRIERLLREAGVASMEVDYSSPRNDRVFFRR